MQVNVIGAETYVKDCHFENRWDLEVSEDQAERIASGVKEGYINVRLVQGRLIQYGDKMEWYGDNYGRIAEGLSLGQIQLQPHESKRPIAEGRSWTRIPTKDAKGWKEIFVYYVYLSEEPSEQLLRQATNNPGRILYEAGDIFEGQCAALTSTLELVIGDNLEEVVQFIQNGKDSVRLL